MRKTITKLEVAAYLGACRLKSKARELIHKERGASDMIAVALMIVVVIALAAIFRTALSEVVTSVVEKVKDWIASN